MKIPQTSPPRGIALIIVMIVITGLSVMVAGFAYSMKVETRLARNAAFDTEMVWLGRSGVELARYVLGQQKTMQNEPFDSLKQKWAGGPGTSNTPLAEISMENVPIGNGTITIKITDCDRKFNINVADERVLQQAMILIGVDISESGPIISSIQDWIDGDSNTRMNGAENDYYLGMDPPYRAKDSPIDDISELLLIKGVTPEVYWGPRYTGPPSGRAHKQRKVGFDAFNENQPMYAVGLVDLFSPFAGQLININTASATTLQMIPEVDENIAQAIIARRSGPDGADGTEDDMPFRSSGELMGVPGMNPQAMPFVTRYCGTTSTTFEVEVQVQLDMRKRTFYSILRRLDQKTIPMLRFYWK